MGWFRNAGSTSSSCCCRKPWLQYPENILGIKSLETKIGVPRMAMRYHRTIGGNRGTAQLEQFHKPVPLTGNPVAFSAVGTIGKQLRGRTDSNT